MKTKKKTEEFARSGEKAACLITFARRLKKLRKDHHMTQAQLAYVLGVSEAVISNYECIRTQPTLRFLITISKKFGVSPDYLLGIEKSEDQ